MDYDTAGYLAEMLALEHATVLELRDDLARFQRRSLENTQSIAEQCARADAAERRAADLDAEVESWRKLATMYEKERDEAAKEMRAAQRAADAARGELARLQGAQGGQWQPVEGYFEYIDARGHHTSINMAASGILYINDEDTGDGTPLPDNIRLCRRVDDAPDAAEEQQP